MVNTNFICPLMKIKLYTNCSLKSCPYNTKNVSSNCLWEYIYSKKTISIMELSLILNYSEKEISYLIKNAKLKLIKSVIAHKLITIPIKFKYCYICGKTFNLKIEDKNKFICISNCVNKNNYKYIEDRFKKPISHILYIFALYLGIGYIGQLIGTPSNKATISIYTKIFRDNSILAKRKDSKKNKFTKRKNKLKIKQIFKKIRYTSFMSMKRNIKKFEGELICSKMN